MFLLQKICTVEFVITYEHLLRIQLAMTLSAVWDVCEHRSAVALKVRRAVKRKQTPKMCQRHSQYLVDELEVAR